MTHKEWFPVTIKRKPVDRPASWLGIPTLDAVRKRVRERRISE